MPQDYYPSGPFLGQLPDAGGFDVRREDFLLGFAERTARAYKADLEDYREWCVGLGVEPMAPSPEDIRRYELGLGERDFSSGTVARRMATLRRFLEHLARAGPWSFRSPTAPAHPMALQGGQLACGSPSGMETRSGGSQ